MLVKYNPEELGQKTNKNFQICVKEVIGPANQLGKEGGLANHPCDSGGLTNFGITLGFLKLYNIDLNGDGIIDERDIFEMTKSQAEWCYYKFIWMLHKYDKFSKIIIASKVFDMSVNMGEAQANKNLQRAINHVILKNKLAVELLYVDGVRGRLTLKESNEISTINLIEAICDEAEDYYKDLIKRRPKDKVFENNWMKRAKWHL